MTYCHLPHLPRLLYCTETPSALISPAAIGDTDTDVQHHSALTSSVKHTDTCPNPRVTCNTSGLNQGVPSTDLEQEQSVRVRSTDHTTQSPLIVEHSGKKQAIKTENTITSPNTTEVIPTRQTGQSIELTSAKVDATTSPTKVQTFTLEQAVQTEHTENFPVKIIATFSTERAVQAEHTMTNRKYTKDQALQTEPATASRIEVENCTTEQAVQTENTMISPMKATKCIKEHAIQTAHATTSLIRTEKCTTEQAMQTESEPVRNSSEQNTWQQETQQLLEQISELKNTCLHQSLIIQAMSRTETIQSDRAKTDITLLSRRLTKDRTT